MQRSLVPESREVSCIDIEGWKSNVLISITENYKDVDGYEICHEITLTKDEAIALVRFLQEAISEC